MMLRQGKAIRRLEVPKVYWVLVLLGVGIELSSYWIQILVNTSSSLPQVLFIVQKGKMPQKGDFVSFVHPVLKTRLVKRVEGVAGDLVTVQGDKVYISGEFKGALVPHNSRGEPLVPVKDQTIEEGAFFVQGDHERSFDSRYERFGLIPDSAIEGKAWSPL